MRASAILLAAILCLGLASPLVAKSAFAQVIELPPLFPPPDDPVPDDGDETGSVPEGNSTEQTPGNFTSLPPPEPPAEQPAGNESEEQPIVPQEEIISTNPCLEYDEESNIVHVVCDADIYELFSGLRDDSIMQQLGSGQILINTNITVDDSATFNINSDKGVNYVKIAGNNGITVLGSLRIDGVNITSWDTASNSAVEQDGSGSIRRAYLFFSSSEGSYIYNSDIGYMGYNATGYRGVDLMYGSHNFAIVNSSFHHMWYAFYSNAAYNVTIDSSEYYDNHLYAVDPHTGTHNMTISNNIVHNNPIGLVCSLDCYDITFEGNTIYNNSGAGIFFSRNTHDSVARYNTIYDQPVGVAFSESSNNQVYGNNIISVGRGIFLNNPEIRDDGDTTGNRIYNNAIDNSAVGIAALRTSGNVASNNLFHNITMSHYRLDGGSTLTIDNQMLANSTIEGRAGTNIPIFTNCSTITIDANTYDASIQHSVPLSNQTITVASVPRESGLQ
ncbi:MAG: right-handed parallel beta-helix repeat-containing protein [Thermoproteota archaeon]